MDTIQLRAPRRVRKPLPGFAGLAIAVVVGHASLLQSDVLDCDADLSNHQIPGEPAIEAVSPHECTRWVSFRNCCQPPEQPTCQRKWNQIVLSVHWEISGDANCRAGWEWPGGSCHSPGCSGVFQVITDAPGTSGDYAGDTYDQFAECKEKMSEHFGYNQRLVSTEAFHYKGWCSILGIIHDTVEQDCGRTKTEKIENCVIHQLAPVDCSTESGCQ